MRLIHYKALADLQVKILKNTLINVGLVRLIPWEWLKVGSGTAKEQL